MCFFFCWGGGSLGAWDMLRILIVASLCLQYSHLVEKFVRLLFKGHTVASLAYCPIKIIKSGESQYVLLP